MRLTEFFRRVERVEGGWYMTDNGAIRRRSGQSIECPVLAVVNEASERRYKLFESCAAVDAIELEGGLEVLQAADHARCADRGCRALRRRLMTSCEITMEDRDREIYLRATH